MATKIKQKRTYAAPRSAYVDSINVQEEIPTRTNINVMNQAYSDARQQANNVVTQYELNKRKSILQDSIDRNTVNEKILSIGESQRPIYIRKPNNLFLNRTQFKTGGNMATKKSIRRMNDGTYTGPYPVRNFNNVTRDDGSTGNSILYNNGELRDFDNNGNLVGVTRVSDEDMTTYANKPNNQTTPSVDTNTSPVMRNSTFAEAFRQARNAGLTKFTWRGREYGTKYASEVNKSKPTVRRKNQTTRRRRSAGLSRYDRMAATNIAARLNGRNTFDFEGNTYDVVR